MWKDVTVAQPQKPYMTHIVDGNIEDIHFCPFEDIAGVGYATGFSSFVVPGSGEPNIDTFEANPYATAKQKQESEIKKLLEKLPPDTVSLDTNFIGKVKPSEAKAKVET